MQRGRASGYAFAAREWGRENITFSGQKDCAKAGFRHFLSLKLFINSDSGWFDPNQNLHGLLHGISLIMWADC
jgi:hypothetical protein